MNLKTIRLEAGDPEKIIGNPEKQIQGDVRKLLGSWNQALKKWSGERRTIRLNPDGTPVDKVEAGEGLIDAPHEHTSGYRIDIIPLGYDPAEYEYDEATDQMIEVKPQGTVYKLDVIMPDFVSNDSVDSINATVDASKRYS